MASPSEACKRHGAKGSTYGLYTGSMHKPERGYSTESVHQLKLYPLENDSNTSSQLSFVLPAGSFYKLDEAYIQTVLTTTTTTNTSNTGGWKQAPFTALVNRATFTIGSSDVESIANPHYIHRLRLALEPSDKTEALADLRGAHGDWKSATYPEAANADDFATGAAPAIKTITYLKDFFECCACVEVKYATNQIRIVLTKPSGPSSQVYLGAQSANMTATLSDVELFVPVYKAAPSVEKAIVDKYKEGAIQYWPFMYRRVVPITVTSTSTRYSEHLDRCPKRVYVSHIASTTDEKMVASSIQSLVVEHNGIRVPSIPYDARDASDPHRCYETLRRLGSAEDAIVKYSNWKLNSGWICVEILGDENSTLTREPTSITVDATLGAATGKLYVVFETERWFEDSQKTGGHLDC